MENKIRRSLPFDLHSDEFGYPFNILNDICNHLNGFPCIELNYDNAPKIECMRNLKPVNGHYAFDLLIIDVSKLLMKNGVTYKSISINDVLKNHEEAITLKNRDGERYFISKMAAKPDSRLSSYKENNKKYNFSYWKNGIVIKNVPGWSSIQETRRKLKLLSSKNTFKSPST